VTTATHDIAELRSRLRGRLIEAGDPEYDEVRTVFLGGIDRRPAAIARVADAADVARVVTFARESGTELAVRCGGHSGAGYGTTDGGVVLDLREMKGLEIDEAGRTAWAEAGLTAGEYTTAAAAYGLATGFGDTASVGIGGLTLGGGVGYLARKLGLTIDSLLAADVVTADGQRLRADAVTNPDLFWAIRGGGGNFGVAARFQFRLEPIDGVLGGMLILPATPDVIAGFIEAAEAAADELTAIANIMPSPPMPFVPAEYHGRLILMAVLVHSAGGEAGERAVAPLRKLATPIADMIRPMKYPEIYPPDDPSYHPKAVSRTLFVDTVDRSVAQTIVDHLEASDAAVRVAQLRVLGSAVARVPADTTAYAHRARRIMANVAAFYEGPADQPLREAWVTKFAEALNRGDDAGYVNFLGDEGQARVRAAYPGETWKRLAAIKARYDPANLFRLNQNIMPAAEGVRT
jgi:FAD/FMN-containing dehydrogenase